MSIDAIADVKQALEILEYVLNITATNQNVATTLRHPLIKAWVLCKALLNQTIPKNYQIEKDDSNSAISRALCASEVMFLKCKDILEVSSVPTLNEVNYPILVYSYSFLYLYFNLTVSNTLIQHPYR